MRSSPLLLVGVLLAVAIAGLIGWRVLTPPPAPLPILVIIGDPLVALPWDETVPLGFGAVAVDVPRGWTAGGGPVLVGFSATGRVEAALTARLVAAGCASPVVLRWREQWRGECLSATGTRIRGAVIRAGGRWRGVEARYPDGRDARLAPRVGRMLASLRRVE